MSANSLSVDELRRMMLVFDKTYYDKSFAAISDEFTSSFSRELDLNNNAANIDHTQNDLSMDGEIASNEHFRFLLASTLITLLNDRFNSQRRLQTPDNKVINHGFFKPFQRLIALYLVYNLYKHKAIGHHPFLPHFMQIIDHCPREEQQSEEKEKKTKTDKTIYDLVFAEQVDEDTLSARFAPLCDKIEAEFIVKLLFNRDIDVISKMSPIKFTKVYYDKLINDKLEKWPEFAQIQQLISSRHNKNFTYSPLKALGVNPILRDYDLNLDIKLAPFAVDDQSISDLALNLEFNNYATFEPEFVRPEPPFMIPFAKQEMRWQFLGTKPQLIWDDSDHSGAPLAAQPISDNHSMSDLMKLSLKQKLNEHQQTLLINEMKSNSSFIPCNKLNALCAHNPYIAMQTFLILKHQNNTLLFNQYLSALSTLNVADVETAQNSMNFMKEITQKIKVSKKYIVSFIAHCIKSCEDTKEPFHQTRLVRYICIFVQKLIKDKIITIKDGAVEIEAFCLVFSRIPEATKLYKLLKQQNIDTSNDSAPNETDSNDNTNNNNTDNTRTPPMH